MMTPTARLRPVASLLVALAFVVCGAPRSTGQVALAQEQTLFVSVADANGEPVTDLGPNELTVVMDGEDSETLNLEPFNWPVRLTIFVDNGEGGRTSVGQIRDGLQGFLDAIPQEVEVALLTTAGRPQWVVRHTTDRAELTSGIDLITPIGGSGATFMDSLVEEAKRLDDDDEGEYFPVIVMVATDGADTSGATPRRYEEALRRLVENSATVHTLMLATAGNQGGIASQVGANVAEVTRGTHESLAVASAFATMLPELGQDIARKHKLVSNQYRLTYKPPDDVSDRPSLSIAISRSGLKMFPTLDGNVP
jgi:hypothetical protein